ELAVRSHDKQDEPVINALSPYFPFLEGLHGPIFDRSVARRLTDVHNELMAGRTLVFFKPCVQRAGGAGRHEAGCISNPLSGGWRDRRFGCVEGDKLKISADTETQNKEEEAGSASSCEAGPTLRNTAQLELHLRRFFRSRL